MVYPRLRLRSSVLREFAPQPRQKTPARSQVLLFTAAMEILNQASPSILWRFYLQNRAAKKSVGERNVLKSMRFSDSVVRELPVGGLPICAWLEHCNQHTYMRGK